MEKSKSKRWTPKKIIITCLCVLVLLVIIAVAAIYGAYTYTKNNSISEAKAFNIALNDAKVNKEAVNFERIERDFDGGHFVYDIDFSDIYGGEYSYTIKGSNGKILDKELEPATNKATNESIDSVPVTITGDKAKQIALSNAGLSASDVTYTKATLETDNGRQEYSIEFYVGNTEYDYTIDAVSGTILEHDKGLRD